MMKKALFLFLVPVLLSAAENDEEPLASSLSVSTHSQTKSTMAIDPKARALDFKQAFDLLRKEKTANKVVFLLVDGSTISNIIDIKIMGNGSLLLFRHETPQGIRFQTVAIEEISALKHL
jgi:hypothetical protein